jgi:diguanylate cyclase (GGDEF)-like protein
MAQAAARDFSGLNTRVVVDYVRTVLGLDGVEALLSGAQEDRSMELLLDDTTWSSYAQFRRLLETAARLVAECGGLGVMAGVPGADTKASAELATMMQALGSPLAVALTTADAAASLYPLLATTVEVLAPTHVRFRRRVLDDYEPFPELCAFFTGLVPRMVYLFGLRVLEVAEVQCQLRGDEDCVTELRWDETADLVVQRDLMHMRMEIAENRLQAFQQTVHDIVSVDDVTSVLTRIVQSAARATTAPGFVLSVDALPPGTGLFADGLTVDEAEQVLADADSYLCVEVASARQRYGRLLAVVPPSSAFHERTSLEAYARLAATALDSAFALEEARREAQAAEALLRLSRSLADLTSSVDLAATLTRAVVDVIDCDGSAVLLISNGVARMAAHYGCPPELADELDRQEFSGNELAGLLKLDRHTREQMSPQGQALMDSFGWQAMAAVPLEVDGETYGMLIATVRDDPARFLDDAKLTDRFAGLAGQAAVALRNSQLMDQIRHQALHDPLTQIPNRALLMQRAEQMLAEARRGTGTVAAMFLDLDGFKEVNDTLGHDIGDGLLQAVAARLKSVLRDQDTVGRLGGDEFIVLVDCGSMDTDVSVLADRLLRAVQEPLLLPGCDQPITVGASIGVAVGDRPCAEDLLHDADMALYQAKASGKSCYRMFTSELRTSALVRDVDIPLPRGAERPDDRAGGLVALRLDGSTPT